MNKLDERGWKRLISAISNKEVVPIIGKELFKVNGEPLQTYINKQVCKNLFVEYRDGMTVDQIVDVVNTEEGDGKRKFCNELSKIFSKIDIPIPECIKKLIDINCFPMLLTTSYTPLLERYLKDKGHNWKSYAYDTTAKADIPSTVHDNKESAELKENVLYYIFGKIGVEGTFVVDEDDLLSFLHFWHDENTRPKELCKYLSDKYLLVIGCDYPDWLFRFLWYSMNNNFNEKSLKKGQLVISNKRVMEDIELQSFLRRIKAYYDNDIDEFILELCKRCKKEVEPTPMQDDKVDFFISYAHEDYEIADKIASLLRDLGASVWFDRAELRAGDQFPDEIRENIEECKRFMPILSNNTTQETRRFFRKEWTIAKNEAELRLGIPYITPVSIDNVNIKHHLIPTEFSNVHVLRYQDGIEEELRDLIREIRRN